MSQEQTRRLPVGGSSTAHWLEIVSYCPLCGAPIYGRKAITDTPEVVYGCICHKRFQSKPSCLEVHPTLGAVCIRPKGHTGNHSRPWSDPSILEW